MYELPFKLWFGNCLTWSKYFVLRIILGTALRWSPLNYSNSGYTVIIGVPWQMWELVDIPLLSLQCADRTGCQEVILSLDTTANRFLRHASHQEIEKKIQSYSDLNPRLIFYNKWQYFVSRIFRWNWIDCWLTWAIGIAEARTRFALLHDFDAVVIDPKFLLNHFNLIRERNSVFVGIQNDDRFNRYGKKDIFMTIELMVDIYFLKSQYAPIDLFNRLRTLDADLVVCDILRDVQLSTPPEDRTFHALQKGQVVHPSQLVSHWHKMNRSLKTFEPIGYSSILIIPYFRHLTGDSAPLTDLTKAIRSGHLHVKFEGGSLSLNKLDQAGCDWISEQIEMLESYFSEKITTLVIEYCESIRSIPYMQHSN